MWWSSIHKSPLHFMVSDIPPCFASAVYILWGLTDAPRVLRQTYMIQKPNSSGNIDSLGYAGAWGTVQVEGDLNLSLIGLARDCGLASHRGFPQRGWSRRGRSRHRSWLALFSARGPRRAFMSRSAPAPLACLPHALLPADTFSPFFASPSPLRQNPSQFRY